MVFSCPVLSVHPHPALSRRQAVEQTYAPTGTVRGSEETRPAPGVIQTSQSRATEAVLRLQTDHRQAGRQMGEFTHPSLRLLSSTSLSPVHAVDHVRYSRGLGLVIWVIVARCPLSLGAVGQRPKHINCTHVLVQGRDRYPRRSQSTGKSAWSVIWRPYDVPVRPPAV